jgi:hypothetical protein
VLVVTALLVAGLGLRYAVWEATRPIRSAGDAATGLGWGQQARREGLVQLYERLVRETSERPQLRYEGMDYMPGRLAVMTAWAVWADGWYPGANRRRDDFWFNLPPLLVNTLAELAAALAAAGLVRELGGTARQGLVAAVTVWLHPAVLILGHGRPQWDTWLLPFFLGSALTALRGRWAISGLIASVGVMFKAQILFGAAVLPLLALFDRRARNALLWFVGFVVGLAACLGPWLLRGSLAPVRVAIVGGATKWPTFPPPYVRNLGTLASRYLGWSGDTRLLGLVKAESLFVAAAVVALVGSAFLAHRRRGVHRFVALVIPWFAFYLLMPGMHLRYIVWPVVFLSVALVFDLTYLACWTVLAAVSAMSILGPMVVRPKSPFGDLAALASAMSPLELWVIVACTLVLLWKAAAEGRAGTEGPS